MKLLVRPFAVAALLAFGLAFAGCDSGGGPSSASCSSCQEDYTEADCQAWGALAGCETATTSPGSCDPGFMGCSFTNCKKGLPICNDTGEASCASCSGSLTQADCDALAASASCASATTGDFNACGNDVTGCHFLGCAFEPSCD